MSFAELWGCQVTCAEQEVPLSLAGAEVSLQCMPRMVLQPVCSVGQGVSKTYRRATALCSERAESTGERPQVKGDETDVTLLPALKGSEQLPSALER